jgi:hypothetical protein
MDLYTKNGRSLSRVRGYCVQWFEYGNRGEKVYGADGRYVGTIVVDKSRSSRGGRSRGRRSRAAARRNIPDCPIVDFWIIFLQGNRYALRTISRNQEERKCLNTALSRSTRQ